MRNQNSRFKRIRWALYSSVFFIAQGARSEVVFFPPLNVEARAEIGETIVSSASTPNVLPADVSEDLPAWQKITVHSGALKVCTSEKLREPTGIFLCSTATMKTWAGNASYEHAGIFVPNDKSKPSVLAYYAGDLVFSKVPLLGRWTVERFKKELIYAGVSQNTISILYREFKDDFARPAFSQDLKYDLTQGNVIGYKGARFEVIKATNTELVYKVIQQPN